MEDLIPFLIFIIIAVVNLLKFAAEKGGRKKPGPAPAPTQAPKRRSATLEEFFEDLAEQFEPRPTEFPEWPESRERPDYMQEMEAFETAGEPVYTKEQAEEVPAKPVKEFEPIPVIEEVVEPASEIQRADHVGSLKSAMKSMPVMFTSARSMHITTAPILRSSYAGSIDFPLKEKSELRKAIIANLIFSPPRAYDVSFDNTISK